MPNAKCVSALRAVHACALATALAGIASTAAASTVVPMSVETLSDHAAQVIVGRVVSVRSYWADPAAATRRIESEVVFDEVEYLKGALPDSTSTFTLTVPGGTVGDTHMELCCAPSFAVGEKWMLFLLPTYKTFPVVGIYQGAFVVQADADGIERVYMSRHHTRQPVAGIDDDGLVQVAGSTFNAPHDHLVAANNIRLLDDQASAQPREALTFEAFLSQLRPILDASRAHNLTEPAGRPVVLDYSAVPLRRSPMSEPPTAVGGPQVRESARTSRSEGHQ